MSCGGMGGRERSPPTTHPHPSRPEAGGRAGSKVIRAEELVLYLISCHNLEKSWKHSGAGPGGVGLGEPTLRM